MHDLAKKAREITAESRRPTAPKRYYVDPTQEALGRIYDAPEDRVYPTSYKDQALRLGARFIATVDRFVIAVESIAASLDRIAGNKK
jgi:hypothetical protein